MWTLVDLFRTGTMKTLAEWLARKPAGPKPKKPLKRTPLKPRTKRVRPVSKKMARKLAVYRVKRVEYLATHDTCVVGPILWNANILESNCTYSATEIHHKARRLGENLNDESTWIATCAECHRYVETHAKKARELGLLF